MPDSPWEARTFPQAIPVVSGGLGPSCGAFTLDSATVVGRRYRKAGPCPSLRRPATSDTLTGCRGSFRTTPSPCRVIAVPTRKNDGRRCKIPSRSSRISRTCAGPSSAAWPRWPWASSSAPSWCGRSSHALYRPLIQSGHDPKVFLRTLSVVDPFSIHMEIAIFGGLILSLPFLLYFIGQFLLPALTVDERKLLGPDLRRRRAAFRRGRELLLLPRPENDAAVLPLL